METTNAKIWTGFKQQCRPGRALQRPLLGKAVMAADMLGLRCMYWVSDGGHGDLSTPIGAGRLQHISQILQVPVPFFFEGAPTMQRQRNRQNGAPSPAYVSDFLATSDGLTLTRAFVRIKERAIRRCIVQVAEVAGQDD